MSKQQVATKQSKITRLIEFDRGGALTITGYEVTCGLCGRTLHISSTKQDMVAAKKTLNKHIDKHCKIASLLRFAGNEGFTVGQLLKFVKWVENQYLNHRKTPLDRLRRIALKGELGYGQRAKP